LTTRVVTLSIPDRFFEAVHRVITQKDKAHAD
jgi:hypothetical protein